MNNYKKYLFGFVFLIILFLGIFLRTYNFEDWLFFQGDQARDGFLVNKVVENGPSWLPLLGPKAGGTYLRLGPIFYYFESASVAIFGNETPATLAYPDLLFSILAIGLFYLFLREIFPKSWSLALMLGYSVCYFAIQYSRFAWNPNSLAFFNLLFFYSLFKFFQAAEKKKKILWSIFIGISYGVAGQLHFVSFLIFPIILIFVFAVRAFYFKEEISSHAKYLAMIAFIFFINSLSFIILFIEISLKVLICLRIYVKTTAA